MLYGYIADGKVTLDPNGLPIHETEMPPVPAGQKAVESWVTQGDAIVQTWTVVPEEGTEAAAAIELAKMSAESLTDESALRVVALYPEWSADAVKYTHGKRLRYRGVLYRVLQEHTSQASWNPPAAPSLFARVLPGQSGEVGEWVRPGSTEGYSKGDRVTHGGKTWESIIDGNVHEPGTDNGAAWKVVS